MIDIFLTVIVFSPLYLGFTGSNFYWVFLVALVGFLINELGHAYRQQRWQAAWAQSPWNTLQGLVFAFALVVLFETALYFAGVFIGSLLR